MDPSYSRLAAQTQSHAAGPEPAVSLAVTTSSKAPDLEPRPHWVEADVKKSLRLLQTCECVPMPSFVAPFANMEIVATKEQRRAEIAERKRARRERKERKRVEKEQDGRRAIKEDKQPATLKPRAEVGYPRADAAQPAQSDVQTTHNLMDAKHRNVNEPAYSHSRRVVDPNGGRDLSSTRLKNGGIKSLGDMAVSKNDQEYVRPCDAAHANDADMA